MSARGVRIASRLVERARRPRVTRRGAPDLVEVALPPARAHVPAAAVEAPAPPTAAGASSVRRPAPKPLPRPQERTPAVSEPAVAPSARTALPPAPQPVATPETGVRLAVTEGRFRVAEPPAGSDPGPPEADAAAGGNEPVAPLDPVAWRDQPPATAAQRRAAAAASAHPEPVPARPVEQPSARAAEAVQGAAPAFARRESPVAGPYNAPASAVAVPPVVIERIEIVTPPAHPPAPDPLASLAARRAGTSRHGAPL